MDTPRIYVACLAAYNNGFLHGVWIDCDEDADCIHAKIQAMLKTSPAWKIGDICEEWAIHDYENWQGFNLSEWEDIDQLVEWAELLEEHGEAITQCLSFAEIAQYYDHYGTVEGFEDRFMGEYETKEDFVRESLKNQGVIDAVEKAGLNEFYINFKQLAYDWFIDSYFCIEVSYQKVYVFCNY